MDYIFTDLQVVDYGRANSGWGKGFYVQVTANTKTERGTEALSFNLTRAFGENQYRQGSFAIWDGLEEEWDYQDLSELSLNPDEFVYVTSLSNGLFKTIENDPIQHILEGIYTYYFAFQNK